MATAGLGGHRALGHAPCAQREHTSAKNGRPVAGAGPLDGHRTVLSNEQNEGRGGHAVVLAGICSHVSKNVCACVGAMSRYTDSLTLSLSVLDSRSAEQY